MLDRTAFCLVFANFGMAIAARMPMMTTTMSNSINVKPLRAGMRAPDRMSSVFEGQGLRADAADAATAVPHLANDEQVSLAHASDADPRMLSRVHKPRCRPGFCNVAGTMNRGLAPR